MASRLAVAEAEGGVNHTPRPTPKRPWRPRLSPDLHELAAYVGIGFFLGAATTMLFVLWRLR